MISDLAAGAPMADPGAAGSADAWWDSPSARQVIDHGLPTPYETMSPEDRYQADLMTHTRSVTEIGTPPESMRARPVPRPGSVTEEAEDLLGIDPFISARGTLLPMGRDADGDAVLAWPEAAIGAVEGFLMPGHLAQGGSATEQEMERASLEMAGFVTGGAIPARMASGVRPSLGMGGGRRALPMDKASRMRRAQDQGYDLNNPAYRGDEMPSEYPKGARFTYDPDYAAGFAHRGGVREFTFRDRNALGAGHPVTLGHLRDIARAIQSREGDAAAQQFVQANSSISDDLKTFFEKSANADPNIPVARDGTLTLRYIQQQTGDHKNIAREAGITELHDIGFFDRIVGEGIRNKNKAAFDPMRLDDRNVLATGGGFWGWPLLTTED